MNPFVYSKIFYYRYSPKWVGFLPIFDSLPLVLPLRVIGPSFIGLNIHWIPSPLRQKLCLLIKNIYDRTEPKEAFHITYYMLRNNPSLQFTMTAIRRYYINRCMNVIEIPGDMWQDLPLLSTNKYRARFLKLMAPAGLLKRPT